MNFSLNPGIVRAEQFKESGKWYQTFALDMSDYYHEYTPLDAVCRAMVKADIKLADGWTLVVFEPYHIVAIPCLVRDTSPTLRKMRILHAEILKEKSE